MMDWEIENLNENDHPFLYYSSLSSKVPLVEPSCEPCCEATCEPPVESTAAPPVESSLVRASVEAVDQVTDLVSEADHITSDLKCKDNLKMIDLQEKLSSFTSIIISIMSYLFGIYFFFIIFTSLRRDLLLKGEEMAAELLKEISDCSRHYSDNYCHLDGPALKDLCLKWKTCLSRPVEIKNLKIILGYAVEVLNWLLELVSWKSILFLGTIFIVSITMLK